MEEQHGIGPLARTLPQSKVRAALASHSFPRPVKNGPRGRSESAAATPLLLRDPGPCSSHTLGSVGPAALLTMHGAQVITSTWANRGEDGRDLRFVDRCEWGSWSKVVVC